MKGALFGVKRVDPRNYRLTQRQEQVLLFMWEFFKENDQLPPAHTIKENFGFSSDNGPYEMCVALERKGFLAKNSVNKFKFTQKAKDEMEGRVINIWSGLVSTKPPLVAGVGL